MRIHFWCAVWVLSTGTMCRPQTAPVEEHFAAFLALQDTLADHIEAEGRRGFQFGAQAENRVIGPLRLGPADFHRLTPLARQLRSDLERVRMDVVVQRGFSTEQARMSRLLELQTQRVQMLRAAMDRVKAVVTPQGWKAIEEWLNAQALLWVAVPEKPPGTTGW